MRSLATIRAVTVLLLLSLVLSACSAVPVSGETPGITLTANVGGGEHPLSDQGERTGLSVAAQDYSVLFQLTDSDGSPVPFGDRSVLLLLGNTFLRPGEENDSGSLSVLSDENGAPIGYILDGEFSENKQIAVVCYVTDADEAVIHRMELTVDYETEPAAFVRSSFNYDAKMSTEALLDAAMNQYTFAELGLFSSSDLIYDYLVQYFGGFRLLEDREDALAVLIDRYRRVQNGETFYFSDTEGELSNDWLIGTMLREKDYWTQADSKQQTDLCSLMPDYFTAEKFALQENEAGFAYPVFLRGYPDATESNTYTMVSMGETPVLSRHGKYYDDGTVILTLVDEIQSADDGVSFVCLKGTVVEPTVFTVSTYTYLEVTVNGRTGLQRGDLIAQERILVTPNSSGDCTVEVLEIYENPDAAWEIPPA